MSLPKRFPDRDEIAGVRIEVEHLEAGAYLEAEGGAQEQRRLAGRVMARRDMGSAVFLDLVDRSGRLQIAFLKKEVAKAVDVKLGDIIGVEGVPGKTRRGEPSLFAADPPLLLSPERAAALATMTPPGPLSPPLPLQQQLGTPTQQQPLQLPLPLSLQQQATFGAAGAGAEGPDGNVGSPPSPAAAAPASAAPQSPPTQPL